MDNNLFPFFFRAKPYMPKELRDDESSLYVGLPQKPKPAYHTSYYGRKLDDAALPY